MSDAGDIPGDALDDIAYLARSEPRIRVLQALSTETRSCRDLAEQVAVSRSTLDRTLGELEERGWVERRSDEVYSATPTGEHLSAQFGPLLRSVETLRALEAGLEAVPADELSIGPADDVRIGLHHFDDAVVQQPAETDPSDVTHRLADLAQETTTFFELRSVPPSTAVTETLRERLSSGELTHQAVYAGCLIDYLRDDADPEDGPSLERLMTDAGQLYRYWGDIPCQLFVFDETVVLEENQSTGSGLETFLETDSDVVRTWALGLIDRYIDTADPVRADDLD